MKMIARRMSLVARPQIKAKYDNFINGKFVAPVNGAYFDNVSPIDGKVFTKSARSDKKDIDIAIDAAHKVLRSITQIFTRSLTAFIH